MHFLLGYSGVARPLGLFIVLVRLGLGLGPNFASIFGLAAPVRFINMRFINMRIYKYAIYKILASASGLS